MGNTKLDPRSLNAEERAIVDHEASRFHRDWTGEARYEAALSICEPIILARRAIFGEPASEGGKVECPNCHHEDTGHAWKVNGELRYSCKGWNKPAQPEPVAAEMPEAVSVNTWQLEELLKYADLAEVSLRTGFHPPEFLFEPADRSLRQCIDAIKEQRDQWRTHAAQPAKARMTEELERVLDAAEIAEEQARVAWVIQTPRSRTLKADIAAVRAHAAEAGKVRLPKVNEALWLLRKRAMEKKDLEVINEAQREVDAAEGRK